MELRQLATFRAVATSLSFTKAASTLHYVQSSVTAQVQALEAELGVRLFDRLGRRIALTESGRRLLPYAERMVELAEEARAAIREEEEPLGTLTLSAPETLCTYRLPGLLRAYRSRYPGVRLVFRPTPSDEMRRAVADGGLDVAFILDEPFRAQGLAVEPLVRESLVVVAAPDHPLVGATRPTPAELAAEAVLLTEAGCSYRALFLRLLALEGVHPATTLDFGSVEAIKQCAMAGMGLALLPEVAVAAELGDGRLARLAWPADEIAQATNLVWHRERWQAPALRAFLALARAMLSSAPDVPLAGADGSRRVLA